MTDTQAFYSDIVEKELESPFKSIAMYPEYIQIVKEHLISCEEFIKNNPNIKSVFVQFSLDPDTKKMSCMINGHVPWSQEKINQYNDVVMNEKDEVSEMRRLLEKYPSKALLYLSEIQQEK